MQYLTEKEASLLLKNLQKNGERKFLKTSTKGKKNREKYKKEESSLIKTCITYLQYSGYLVIRNNSGYILLDSNNGKRAIKLGMAGSPDLIACSPEGQFIAIECKSSKGKLSPKQEEFLNKVRELGGKAIVVRSLDELICQL